MFYEFAGEGGAEGEAPPPPAETGTPPPEAEAEPAVLFGPPEQPAGDPPPSKSPPDGNPSPPPVDDAPATYDTILAANEALTARIATLEEARNNPVVESLVRPIPDPEPESVAEIEPSKDLDTQREGINLVGHATVNQLVQKLIAGKSFAELEEMGKASPADKKFVESLTDQWLFVHSGDRTWTAEGKPLEGKSITVNGGDPVAVKGTDGDVVQVDQLLQTVGDIAICMAEGKKVEISRSEIAKTYLIKEAEDLLGGTALSQEQKDVLSWYIADIDPKGDLAATLKDKDPAEISATVRTAAKEVHVLDSERMSFFASKFCADEPGKILRIVNILQGKDVPTPEDCVKIFEIVGVENIENVIGNIDTDIQNLNSQIIADKASAKPDKAKQKAWASELRVAMGVKEALVDLQSTDIGAGLLSFFTKLQNGELAPNDAEKTYATLDASGFQEAIKEQLGIQNAILESEKSTNEQIAKAAKNRKILMGLMYGGGIGAGALIVALIMGMKGGGGQ